MAGSVTLALNPLKINQKPNGADVMESPFGSDTNLDDTIQQQFPRLSREVYNRWFA